MQKSKVTIQMIAEELGLSRNTVSKAINNQYLPEDKKALILATAQEMGYKNFSKFTSQLTDTKQHILILTSKPLNDINFFMSILRGVENIVMDSSSLLFQYMLPLLTNETTATFKTYLNTNKITGIIALDVFNPQIINLLIDLKVPLTFIDCPHNMDQYTGNYDVIMMDNFYATKKVISDVIRTGAQTFGFIGDPLHCRGFSERYMALNLTLQLCNLPQHDKSSITLPDSSPYGDFLWLTEQLNTLELVPNVFLCANDSIAISLVHALTLKNIKVPEDVQVIGFDNIQEATHLTPSLTTVNVPKEELGSEAMKLLLERIKTPHKPSKFLYLETQIIYRESTKVIGKTYTSHM